MFSRGAVVVFALVVAEIFVFGLAVGWFGVVAVLVGSLLASAVGAWIIRRQISALVVSGRDLVATDLGSMAGARVGDRGRGIDRAIVALGGLLLVVPGLITGFAGLLLLLPPIRAAIGRSARVRIAQFVPVGWHGSSRVDVVDVDVVSEDTPQSAPPELS